MHLQRLLIIIGAAAGMLATFLPWVTMPLIGSLPGTKGDGWITFGLFVAVAVLAVVKDRERPLSGGMKLAVAAPALVASMVGVWKIIDFNSKMPKDDNPFLKALAQSVSIGVGLYLVIGAGLVVAAFALALRPKAS
jgi:hypothetical protein